MKIYLSADIEGCCGVTAWNEVTLAHAEYAPFRAQMAAEVKAACEAAVAAGATEILVRDAHGSGRNLLGSDLPRPAKLIRAWSGHPFCMVEGLDESFDAVVFIGYHARAGSGGNPLAHTMSSSRIARMQLNDRPASEYLLHTYAAATVGVPVVFLAGDQHICDEVQAFNSACSTVAVKRGQGATTTNLHPTEAVWHIRETVEHALRGDLAAAQVDLPDSFALEVHYKDQAVAYQKSFYPGAEQLSPTSVGVQAGDYFEILRAVQFLI